MRFGSDGSLRMFSVGQGPQPGITFSASWNMLEVDWADIGDGVVVPERFDAQFEVENDHSVQMKIAVEEGVPVCNDLRVIRHPGKPSLAGHELRRLPLAEWVSYACGMVGILHAGAKGHSAEWDSPEYVKAVAGVARKAKRHNKITPEFLREVARIYKANINNAPVEAVKEAFGGQYRGHSTAARWVKLARDAGYLPPTTRGKVSGD